MSSGETRIFTYFCSPLQDLEPFLLQVFARLAAYQKLQRYVPEPIPIALDTGALDADWVKDCRQAPFGRSSRSYKLIRTLSKSTLFEVKNKNNCEGRADKHNARDLPLTCQTIIVNRSII